jgi:hypothetical protein
MLTRSGKFYGPIRPDWEVKIQEICLKVAAEMDYSPEETKEEFRTLMESLGTVMHQVMEDTNWGTLLLIYLGKLEKLLQGEQGPRRLIPLNLIWEFRQEIREENRR